MNQTTIPGYSYGTQAVPRSPVSMGDFEFLKKTVLFTEEDVKYLKLSHEVLKDQTNEILDVWYGFVGSQPHLLDYFSSKDGKPLVKEYLEPVRKRFEQWVLDTATANYNQAWLDYQHLIGLRHHRIAKNKADNVAAVDHINYRYLPALIYPIFATLKPFLAKRGRSAEEVENMHQAWLKSLILQVTLWSWPYIKDGDF